MQGITNNRNRDDYKLVNHHLILAKQSSKTFQTHPPGYSVVSSVSGTSHVLSSGLPIPASFNWLASVYLASTHDSFSSNSFATVSSLSTDPSINVSEPSGPNNGITTTLAILYETACIIGFPYYLASTQNSYMNPVTPVSTRPPGHKYLAPSTKSDRQKPIRLQHRHPY